MDPCDVNSCPSYPDAICISNYCDGCNAIFVDPATSEVISDCDACEDGYVSCFVDPCQVESCDNFPEAICTPDFCGGCFAIFTDPDGNDITEQCVSCTGIFGDVDNNGQANVQVVEFSFQSNTHTGPLADSCCSFATHLWATLPAGCGHFNWNHHRRRTTGRLSMRLRQCGHEWRRRHLCPGRRVSARVHSRRRMPIEFSNVQKPHFLLPGESKEIHTYLGEEEKVYNNDSQSIHPSIHPPRRETHTPSFFLKLNPSSLLWLRSTARRTHAPRPVSNSPLNG